MLQSPVTHPALALLLSTAQARHGPGILRLGTSVAGPKGTLTGMPALDGITGYDGLPQGRITIFRGHGTSGKMALARPVCFSDISGTCDIAALRARGLDVEALILARPPDASAAIALTSDLLKRS